MPGEGEPDFYIKPVGKVRGGPKNPPLGFSGGDLHVDRGGPRDASAPGESEIVIDERYAECLEGIEEFSHIIVLYWPHMVDERGREIAKVHPAGQEDIAKVGIFSTRSPARPNPICVTTVVLLERDANVLKVEGLDAVDGSPVLDIKPHLPFYDAPEGARLAGWMNELSRRFRGSG
ncbi:MAG: tRNA (N6-threonylcarbamoyladenosine(37)-N6)-methyltransferase TrmO [Actinomycetota bacterium]